MALSQEQLKFIMQRYDNYINGANTKGAFLLAFNTFLCGGLLTNYKTLTDLVGAPHLLYLKLGILFLVLAGIASLVIVLLAVYPFLSSGNSTQDKYHSLIYFGSVAQFPDAKAYHAAILAQDDAAASEDVARQTYLLSKALFSKFKKLEWATKIIFLQLVIVLFCVFLIMCKGV